MKNLALIILIIAGVSAVFGQENEIAPGNYSGSGNIGGKDLKIDLKFSFDNVVVNKSGAVNCMTILSSTEPSGTYEEIDQYDGSTGKPAANSCKEKGFVYLQKAGDGLVYSWNMDKMEALSQLSVITLNKAGTKTASNSVSASIGTAKTSTFVSLLLELEGQIKWEAVEDRWKTDRNAWAADAAKASTVTDAANLLLQLESNVKWESVTDKWAKRRDGWVKETGKANAAKFGALLTEFETALKWTSVQDSWKDRRVSWSGEVMKAKY